MGVKEIILEESIEWEEKKRICLQKLKASGEGWAFKDGVETAREVRGYIENVSSWKTRKEKDSKNKNKKKTQKNPLIEKLLPLSSKQGKAGRLNHEEITLIIYIVYIVSK